MHLPDLHRDLAIGEFDFDSEALPSFPQNGQDGKISKLKRAIEGLLPAILMDALGEVAFGIHQADADQG